MAAPLPALTYLPDPLFVMAEDGVRLATYVWGDDELPLVVLVHGFASSTRDNWVETGWVRDLQGAGYRVLAIDQRGHGASEKPHDARAYDLRQLSRDVEAVLDTYLVDTAHYVGYSLGARVGWEVALALPDRIERVVLGGVPEGIPLQRLDLDQARAYVERGVPVEDTVTQNYVRLTERVQGNDLRALLAIAEGMRAAHTMNPDPARARSSRSCSRRDPSMRSSTGRVACRRRALTADSWRSPTGTISMRRARGCSGGRRSPSSPRTVRQA